MSHITILAVLPKEKLNGDYSEESIRRAAYDILAPYTEGTPECEEREKREESEKSEDDSGIMFLFREVGGPKIDGYAIGGRFSGYLCAEKGAKNILAAEDFPFDFSEQFSVICGTEEGTYSVEDVEYRPVSGGLRKEICREALAKLQLYRRFCLVKRQADSDWVKAHLERGITEGACVRNGSVYASGLGTEILLYAAGESFDDWCNRFGFAIDLCSLDIDAYIDRDGIWHDENELWASDPPEPGESVEEWLEKQRKKVLEFNDILREKKEMFDNQEIEFFRNIDGDDYVVVIDGHKFP